MAAHTLGQAVPGGGPLPLARIKVGDTGSDGHPGCGATWSSTGSESACEVCNAVNIYGFLLSCVIKQPFWWRVGVTGHPGCGATGSSTGTDSACEVPVTLHKIL